MLLSFRIFFDFQGKVSLFCNFLCLSFGKVVRQRNCSITSAVLFYLLLLLLLLLLLETNEYQAICRGSNPVTAATKQTCWPTAGRCAMLVPLPHCPKTPSQLLETAGG